MMKVHKLIGVVLVATSLAHLLRAGELDFRTNINPALLYFQAFEAIPKLSDADSKYLFETGSGPAAPADPLDARRVHLLSEFDNVFKLVRRARFAAVPCDWGYDLSDGPEALLTGLAPGKRVAQAARLRAMMQLDAGNFDALCDDISGACTLARRLSSDHILISALVQYAAENLLLGVASENYYRLTADQLDRFLVAFDSAPRRGTIADTVLSTERDAFYRAIRKQIGNIAGQANGKDELFWPRFTEYWNHIASESSEGNQPPNPNAEEVKEAAGGTAAGAVKLIDDLPAFYDEIGRVTALPYPEYASQAPPLFAKITSSSNPFVRTFLTAFQNVRPKEFAVMVRLEMVRAAAAYKRGGTTALRTVRDPLGPPGGAFEFSRVQVEGVDRGFQLKCPEAFRDFPEVLVFIEKPGRPLSLGGPHAGTPL